jgi:hypothetical protein
MSIEMLEYNAHLRLLTLLCSLQCGAGVQPATLNRCAPPIGKTGLVALWSPQPIFPCCFLTYLRRFGLVSSCLSGCFSKLLAVVVSYQLVARPGLMHPVSPRI